MDNEEIVKEIDRLEHALTFRNSLISRLIKDYLEGKEDKYLVSLSECLSSIQSTIIQLIIYKNKTVVEEENE